MVNKLSTIIKKFNVVKKKLCTIVNKLFTKKKLVFLLIVLKIDMKLNEKLKVQQFYINHEGKRLSKHGFLSKIAEFWNPFKKCYYLKKKKKHLEK